MNYIENNEKYGIKYDLSKISKEYKKLKIPSEFDFIDFGRIEKNKYIIDLSARSMGKTTNYLLYGMIVNKLYGSHIVYIREKADMIKASIVQDLFKVIISYKDGYYIRKITNDKYTNVYYYWRKLYYCNYDEKGNVIDRSEQPFLDFLSIDEHETYKSSLNLPTGDIIIFDEFISRYYNMNSCYMFMDLLKTIIRSRKSAIIFMLANNTNINSPWFEELTIYKQMRHIKKGETIDCLTDRGTHFSIRWLDVKNKEERKEQNTLFFGFSNPKLNSITGAGDWAVDEVRHIPKDFEYEEIKPRYFIRIAPNEFLSMQFVVSKEQYFIIVKRATKVRENDIVFTMKDTTEFTNSFYRFGNDKLLNLVIRYIEQNQILYSTNEVGNDFINYVKMAKNKKIW